MSDRHRDEFGRLWIVVSTEHKREPVANMNLLEAGYTTFFVHYMAMAKHGGRTWPALRSFYPGYIFTAVDNEGDIPPIVRIRGVGGILWEPTDKHYVPPSWVASMKAECLSPEGLHEPPTKEQQRKRYERGQLVRCNGPWEQWAAIVIADSGKAIDVEHPDAVLGRPVKARYDPIQVDVWFGN